MECDERRHSPGPKVEPKGERRRPQLLHARLFTLASPCLAANFTPLLPPVSRRLAGQPAAGGPGAGGGVRRPDDVAERRGRSLGRREFPAAAEAAGLLPAAADQAGEEQGGRPGEGESAVSSSMMMISVGG